MWICNSVQSLNRVRLFATPGLQHTRLPCPRHLPEFVQTHVHRVSDAIQPSHPLLSPSPPAFDLPSIKVFSKDSVLHIRWSKYWSFSFSTSPSNEYSGLISIKIGELISLQSKGLSRVFSNTTVWKINSSARSLPYGPTLTSLCDCYRNHRFNFMDLYWQSDVSAFKYSI